MLFVFKWYHTRRNQWYTNTYRDWDETERRLDTLRSFGVTQIKWITANLA